MRRTAPPIRIAWWTAWPITLALALAACGHDAGTLTREAPLRDYPEDDGPYALMCYDNNALVSEDIESARVFAGGLWELKVKDKAAAEGLLYFRQGDGRLCGLMSPEDARKRLNDWPPTAMR